MRLLGDYRCDVQFASGSLADSCRRILAFDLRWRSRSVTTTEEIYRRLRSDFDVVRFSAYGHGILSRPRGGAALKRSAERSHRRKDSPFQSAMSMLNFYINRAGRQRTDAQRSRLENAKNELREDFDRDPK